MSCRGAGLWSRSPGGLTRVEQRYSPMHHLVAKQAAHLRLCLPKHCSGFDASDNREPPSTHISLPVLPTHGTGDPLPVRQRQPNIVIASRGNPGESLLGYANDREGHIVQLKRLPDHLTRTTEGALPIAIVQYRDGSG